MRAKNYIPCYNQVMSILYLFRESGLTPAKNWLFDSIRGQNRNVTPDGATTAFYTDQVFMYVRIGLDIEIKVNLEQDEIAGGIIDYAHIYQDDRLYRFFVVGCEQIALETIKLKLHLDVLNTFFRTTLGDVLGKRTRTTRKTKRNTRAYDGTHQGNPVVCLNKIIDQYPEGINPQLETTPRLYEEILPNGSSGYDLDYIKSRKWFMVFATIDGVVETFFACDVDFEVKDMSTGNTYTISAIYNVDRSSDDIIRIVNIPYFPENMFFDANTHALLPTGFEVYAYKGHNYLRKVVFSAEEQEGGFIYKGATMDIILNELDTEYITAADRSSYRSVTRSRLDPKLYSSEFYRITLGCDSFAIDIPLEKFIWEDEYAGYGSISNYYLEMNYFVSAAYDGLWMITPSRSPYADEDGLYLRSLEAHPFTLISEKKYEMPISNSAYLEYVKYGYNYDVNRITAKTGYTAAAGFAGAAGATAGLILASIFGGPLGIAAGAIGAIGSIVGTAISAAKVSEMGHLDLNQKLDVLKAQHANVSGSSDATFMWKYNLAGSFEDTRYGGNFSGIVKRIWQPREDVKNMLNDLFYLYGYACNDIGTPNLREKELFDFIQCEAEFDINAVHIEGLTIEYLNEAKQLLAQGVTIFHSYEGTFDTTFTHENFDNYLYIE